MNDFIANNLYDLLVSILGGGSFLAYIFERKKRKIEENQLASNALVSMQEAYTKFTVDQTNRYTEISEELIKTKDQLEKMAITLSNVEEALKKEKEEKERLIQTYEKMEQNYNALSKNYEIILKDYEDLRAK